MRRIIRKVQRNLPVQKIGNWIFAFCFLTTLPALAEVTVTASVEGQTEAEVGLGDNFTYTISVASDSTVNAQQPSPPPEFGTFDVINSFVSSSQSSTFSNGTLQTQRATLFNYGLVPTKPGTFTIPPVSVEVNGQSFKANGVKVVVSNRAGQAQRQRRNQQDQMFEDMDEMEQMFNQLLQRRLMPNMQRGRPDGLPNRPVNPNEAFFIQVETDKTRVYVGEQITVNFYLYTRGQITDIDTLNYPSLKGFWKEDLEMATRLNFEGVTVGNERYQRALLVSYALFPIKAGKAMIDSYKARCTVITPSNFGFGKPYQFTKASRPVEIEVLDVPKDNRPSDFTGAVGQFRVNAQFEPPTVPANQPATLKVRIEGHGNAKLIELPNLNLPPSMELYDQKSDAKFFKDGSSFKQFEVLVIPREPGVFEVPPVRLSVFDPSGRRYQAVASGPLKLSVLGGGAPVPQQAVTTPGGPTPPPSQGPQLPGVSTEFSLHGMWWMQNRALVWSSVYLMVFGLLGFQAWRGLRHRPKKVNLLAILKRRMKTVQTLLDAGEARKVGVELTNAGYFVLGQLSDQGGAHQELNKMLDQVPPSVRKELGTRLQSLFAQLETLSFAPESMLGELATQPKLLELKNEFERVMNRAIDMVDFKDPE